MDTHTHCQWWYYSLHQHASKQVSATPLDSIILYTNMHSALSKYLPPHMIVLSFTPTCIVL